MPEQNVSERKAGDTICYAQGGMQKQGMITSVRAPGAVSPGGHIYSRMYMVDCEDGFPDIVFPSEIIEEKVDGSTSKTA